MCLSYECFALIIKSLDQVDFGCFHAWVVRAHDCLCTIRC